MDTCNYNYIQMDEYQQNGYTVVTMDAYFLINDSCYRHSVKNSICCFPDLFSQFRTKFLMALTKKQIYHKKKGDHFTFCM